ncbi:MAG: PDZ domain-containing protein [Proteobacteria bacterium]|nr:PDZ domain-containing protein [Pseudomonadota bacterium]
MTDQNKNELKRNYSRIGALAAVALILGGVATTEDTRRAFRIGKDINGVVVTSVKPGSSAEEKGLAPGDVIVAIGNEDVRSPDDVAAKIDKARSADRKTVLLLVNRDSNERFIALTLRNA